jgi:hypothetical protein
MAKLLIRIQVLLVRLQLLAPYLITPKVVRYFSLRAIPGFDWV